MPILFHFVVFDPLVGHFPKLFVNHTFSRNLSFLDYIVLHNSWWKFFRETNTWHGFLFIMLEIFMSLSTFLRNEVFWFETELEPLIVWLMVVFFLCIRGDWKNMSYTARPPFSGGMSNQNQQQQQGGQPNNANIGASGIPNMPMINNAASSKCYYFH